MAQTKKSEYLTKLRNFTPPEKFSSRARAKDTIIKLRQGTDSLLPEDKEKLDELDGLLAAAILGELVDNNEITFGMIKPRANQGIGLPDDDDLAAQTIISAIGTENVPLRFHTLIESRQAEKLYGKESIDRLWSVESEVPGVPVAKVLLEFITSEPVTMMLVERPEKDAVEWLAEKVGKTKPSQADPNSIRGKYGRDELLPNNLVHRSDSKGSVLKEIKAMRSIIGDIAKTSIKT